MSNGAKKKNINDAAKDVAIIADSFILGGNLSFSNNRIPPLGVALNY